MVKLSVRGEGDPPIGIYHKCNYRIWVNQWGDIGLIDHVMASQIARILPIIHINYGI